MHSFYTVLVIIVSVLVVLGLGFIGAIAIYLTEDERYGEEDRAKRDIYTKSGRDQSNEPLLGAGNEERKGRTK